MTKKSLILLLFMMTTVGTWSEEDPCSDEMGHKGAAHTVANNRTGTISGTPWGFERWAAQGGSGSLTYYDNGTFSATWSNANDFLARLGFRYGDNGFSAEREQVAQVVQYSAF